MVAINQNISWVGSKNHDHNNNIGLGFICVKERASMKLLKDAKYPIMFSYFPNDPLSSTQAALIRLKCGGCSCGLTPWILPPSFGFWNCKPILTISTTTKPRIQSRYPSELPSHQTRNQRTASHHVHRSFKHSPLLLDRVQICPQEEGQGRTCWFPSAVQRTHRFISGFGVTRQGQWRRGWRTPLCGGDSKVSGHAFITILLPTTIDSIYKL